ncbi:MAG: hypothetical protein VCF24_13305 [Candidatus Latescibacterota bacterium]
MGAGPAGLATSLALARRGRRVLLAERSKSSRRRLCGEFLSGDGCRVLEELGCPPEADCPAIDSVLLSSRGGRRWETAVPGLGKGCSRSRLTESLSLACADLGVERLDGVRVTVYPDQSLLASRDGVPLSIEVQRTVQATGHAGAVRLRPESGRHRRREWMAVAVHGSGQVPLQVQLHATRSGYIGLNPIEGGRLNVCGLLRTPGRSQESSDPLQILLEEADANTMLQKILESIVINPSSTATAAGLDFGRRRHPDNALTVGDAAGAPVPMLGQGLAAALRGGQLLGEMVDEDLRSFGAGAGDEASCRLATSRLTSRYREAWKTEFSLRFAVGRSLQRALLQPFVTDWLLRILSRLPTVGARIVRVTRGSLESSG